MNAVISEQKLIECTPYVEKGMHYLKLVYLIHLDNNREAIMIIPKISLEKAIQINFINTPYEEYRSFVGNRHIVPPMRPNINADIKFKLGMVNDVVYEINLNVEEYFNND